MVVEVGFEAGDGEAFGDFDDGGAHAAWGDGYASEGGTCFLKVSWAELWESRLGYIKYFTHQN